MRTPKFFFVLQKHTQSLRVQWYSINANIARASHFFSSVNCRKPKFPLCALFIYLLRRCFIYVLDLCVWLLFLSLAVLARREKQFQLIFVLNSKASAWTYTSYIYSKHAVLANPSPKNKLCSCYSFTQRW